MPIIIKGLFFRGKPEIRLYCQITVQFKVLRNIAAQSFAAFVDERTFIQTTMTLSSLMARRQPVQRRPSTLSGSTVSSADGQNRVDEASNVSSFNATDLLRSQANVFLRECSEVNFGDQVTNIYKSYAITGLMNS